MDLVVKNGRLVDPARKVDAVANLVIRSGKIQSIGSATVPEVPVFDATGLIVAPGFFDIHVHLREPGTEEAETIATGGSAAAAGGFTAVTGMAEAETSNHEPCVQHQRNDGARLRSTASARPVCSAV